jgi:hypothetical protein
LQPYSIADCKLLLYQGAQRQPPSNRKLDQAAQVTRAEWAEILYYTALAAVNAGVVEMSGVVSRMGTLAGIDAVTRLSLETDHDQDQSNA